MHRSKMFIASVALFACMALGADSANAADDAVSELLEKAKTYQENGNLKKAIDEYEKAVNAKPDSIETQDLLIAALAEQIHKDPKNPKHHAELGKVLQRFGILAAARDEYELALVHSPDYHDKAIESSLEAVKTAQKGIPTPTQLDVDYGPFLADMQKKIKRAWSPPEDEKFTTTSVKFKIHAAGEITDIELDRSSGSPAADELALNAVKTAPPLWPLPRGARVPEEVQYTFDNKKVKKK